MNLKILEQTPDWISLAWRRPADGGKATVYRIQAYDRATHSWQDINLALKRKITLKNQERGVGLQYRVIAVNKAGDGKESNVASAVL